MGIYVFPAGRTRFDAAFARAMPGDIVLLLGKGHEGCIFYGVDKIPWDEAGEARAALHELGYGLDA